MDKLNLNFKQLCELTGEKYTSGGEQKKRIIDRISNNYNLEIVGKKFNLYNYHGAKKSGTYADLIFSGLYAYQLFSDGNDYRLNTWFSILGFFDDDFIKDYKDQDHDEWFHKLVEDRAYHIFASSINTLISRGDVKMQMVKRKYGKSKGIHIDISGSVLSGRSLEEVRTALNEKFINTITTAIDGSDLTDGEKQDKYALVDSLIKLKLT